MTRKFVLSRLPDGSASVIQKGNTVCSVTTRQRDLLLCRNLWSMDSGFTRTWEGRQLVSGFVCALHLVRNRADSHSVPLTPLHPSLSPLREGQGERTARNLKFILGNIHTVQAERVWCEIVVCHLLWSDTTLEYDTNYSEVLIRLPPNAWESPVCLPGTLFSYDRALVFFFFFFLSLSLSFSWNCHILSWKSLNPGLQWSLFVRPHIKHIFHASPNQTQKVPMNKLLGKKSVGSIKATWLEALGVHFDWVKGNLQSREWGTLSHIPRGVKQESKKPFSEQLLRLAPTVDCSHCYGQG